MLPGSRCYTLTGARQCGNHLVLQAVMATAAFGIVSGFVGSITGIDERGHTMRKHSITQSRGTEIRFADKLLKGIKERAHPLVTILKPPNRQYDLQKHEIELEMLNHALRHIIAARAKTETLRGKYINLYDFAPAGYFTLDREGTIRAANLTGANILGVKRSQLIGKSLKSYLSPESCPDFDKFMHDLFADRPSGACEITLPGDGCYTHHVQIETMASVSAQECCLVVTDITERKWAEEQLRKAKKETKAMRMAKELAESATKAKSQYLAVMSHELRTQMSSIYGLLQIALGEELVPKLRSYLEGALNSSCSLLEILNDALDMAKIEAGKLTLEEKPFSLRMSVTEVSDTLISEFRRKGLGFTFSMPEDMPPAVMGDQLRLRQVLTNLICNAAKFTEKGEVKVQVYSGPKTSDAKREFTFAVTDTGIGIPEDKKDLLFQPFSQVEAPHGHGHSHSHCGTGLGLSISRELVELMGGTISCTSTLGVGSTFSFTIPLAEINPEGELKADTGHTSTETVLVLPEHWTPHLLLAEDDPGNRQVFEAMFQQAQIALDIAEDGKQALEMWQKGKYDLVLMDVQMPRLSGFEATRRIRERERTLGGHTPIVAITAHAFKEIEEQCLATGMDGYISKPINVKKCLQTVGQMLGKNHPGDGAVLAKG